MSMSFLYCNGIIVFPSSLKVTKLNASLGLNFSINKQIAYFASSNLELFPFADNPPLIEPDISSNKTKNIGSSFLGAPSLQDFVNIAKKCSGSLTFISLTLFV